MPSFGYLGTNPSRRPFWNGHETTGGKGVTLSPRGCGGLGGGVACTPPPSDQLRPPFLLDTLLHKVPVPLSGLPCPISKLFQDIMGIPPPVLKTLSIVILHLCPAIQRPSVLLKEGWGGPALPPIFVPHIMLEFRHFNFSKYVQCIIILLFNCNNIK
jgi:hypothetical protein